MHPVTQSFHIHNQLTLAVIDAVPEAGWQAKLAKGKAVNEQFAHMHAVRLMWLKAINPSLLEGLAKVESGSQEETKSCLAASCAAVCKAIEAALESGQRVKNFKPTTESFVGYLISHESHHRGQAELILRLAGHPLDDKAAYALWEWGKYA